jgi:hypothetical protein
MNFLKKLMPKIIIALTLFIIPIGIHLSPDNTLQITENITYAATCSGFDVGCYLVNLMELILINLTQFFVGIAGFILDFFLKFTITSSSYRGSGFIEAGWEILRDFTNIVFIFSLLMISFKLVLSQDDGKAKKTLIKIILLALTINFSLFGAFAVMDASNILSYTIYNKIEAPDISFQTRGEGFGKDASFGTSKSMSLALVSKVNPQRLLNELKGDQDTARLTLMFIVAAINISFIYLFLSVALLMLGRTLGLMVLAVLSPLAVASLALGPKGAGLPYVGWNTWFPQFIALSFMAPVFLFFLYLTTLFSKITDNMQISGAAGIVDTIFQISLPMLAIFALVQLSKKVATKMSGEIGGVINGYVQKAAGAAIGVATVAATGGAALAGGAMKGAANRFGAKDARGNLTGAFAKRIETGGNLAQSQNFNFAQSRVGKALFKQPGLEGVGETLSKAGNISYSRADTAVRSGVNTAREKYDNFTTGKNSERTEKWQNDVEESRRNLIDKRAENTKREAEENAKGKFTTATVGADGKLNPLTGTISGKNTVKNRIEKLESDLILQEPADAKIEKGKVRDAKAKIQEIITAEEANKSEANKQISELTKAIDNYPSMVTKLTKKRNDFIDELADLNLAADTPPTAQQAIEINKIERSKANAKTELETFTDTTGVNNIGVITRKKSDAVKDRNKSVTNIEKAKENQEKVEEKVTIKGQIGQLKKIVENEQKKAVSEMIKTDYSTNKTTQDSSLTINSGERQRRVQRRAAELGRGDTKPKSKDKKDS